jgi:hypothetical protein
MGGPPEVLLVVNFTARQAVTSFDSHYQPHRTHDTPASKKAAAGRSDPPRPTYAPARTSTIGHS